LWNVRSECEGDEGTDCEDGDSDTVYPVQCSRTVADMWWNVRSECEEDEDRDCEDGDSETFW